MSRPWNPLQDLMILQDRMNRLFEDATQRRIQNEADQTDEVEVADWFPAADITESAAEYVINVDLPGIDRKSLDISVNEDRLVIQGSRTVETSPQRVERPSGRFVRSFGIPASVDQTKITAEYKDGVLNVTLPKQAAPKAKRVEITIS